MSKYKAKAELTKESILGKVSEIDIFSYYIKNFVDLNKRFCSELREDHTPDCCIIYKYNRLFYKDFVTNDVFNCFTYVMKKFGVNYYTALKIISNDFNLNLCDPIGKPTQEKYGTKSKIMVKESPFNEIRVKYRDWGKIDDEYWSNYCITASIARYFNIWPISHYFINDHCFKASKLAYGEFIGSKYWKIYQPFETQGVNKWYGNIPQNLYFGYDQLPWIFDNLVITSSLKDVMVWYLCGYNAIAPQGESIIIPQDFINQLLKRNKGKIYINYDNDETGIKSANKYSTDYERVFVPDQKDISDFIHYYGLDSTKQMIKEIIK